MEPKLTENTTKFSSTDYKENTDSFSVNSSEKNDTSTNQQKYNGKNSF